MAALLAAAAAALTEASWRPRLEALARQGAWASALALLADVRARGGEVGPGGWSAALAACARASPPAWAAAVQALEEVEAPCAKCYTSAIAACREQWSVALDLFGRMCAAGVPADAPALTACVRALSEAGEWELAVALFQAHPTRADRRLLRAVLRACAWGGQPEAAEAIVRSAPLGGGGDAATHHALVVARLRARQPGRAFRLLRAMRARGFALSEASFHALLRDAVARGRPFDGLAILREMAAASLPPTSTALRLGVRPAVIHPTAWRAAVEYLELIDPLPPPAAAAAAARDVGAHIDGATINLLLRSCWEAAAALLRHFAPRGRGELPAMRALTLAALGRARKARRALYFLPSLFRLPIHHLPPPSACSPPLSPLPPILATPASYRDATQTALALQLLSELEADGMATDCRCYTSAIGSCASDWRLALSVWVRMRRRRILPTARCGGAALKVLRRGGRWKESLTLLRHLETLCGAAVAAELRPMVVGACVEAGEWGAALGEERKLPASSPRKRHALQILLSAGAGGGGVGGGDARREGKACDVRTMEAIHAALGLCAPGGRWREAIGVLRLMRGVCEPTDLTLSLVIGAAERGKQWALVLQLCGALEAEDALASQAAVRSLAALGRWEEAVAALGAMAGLADRETHERVLLAMARDGAWREAGQLLQRMLARGPAAGRVGFLAVAGALARAGEWREAMRVLEQMEQWADVYVDMETFATMFDGLLTARRTADDSSKTRLDDALIELYQLGEQRGLLPPLPDGILSPVNGTLQDSQSTPFLLDVLPAPVACGCAIAALTLLKRAGQGDVPLPISCNPGPTLDSVSDVLESCGRRIRVARSSSTSALMFVAEVV
ncbi:hypothetical protein AB1Y20_005520 [Prymnesium parvum]|uniref:Pentacotripeptide-repeat region of PRORP domain-containing protein n=1 Tax=Prymnesium parvum TaxID=97485 RepID=A0AB34J6I7_PRYPA